MSKVITSCQFKDWNEILDYIDNVRIDCWSNNVLIDYEVYYNDMTDRYRVVVTIINKYGSR